MKGWLIAGLTTMVFVIATCGGDDKANDAARVEPAATAEPAAQIIASAGTPSPAAGFEVIRRPQPATPTPVPAAVDSQDGEQALCDTAGSAVAAGPLSYDWRIVPKASAGSVSYTAGGPTTGVVVDAGAGEQGQTADYQIVPPTPRDRTAQQSRDATGFTIINVKPTACAGRDVAIMAGDSVRLSGEKSIDPETDPLTYRWKIVTRPTGSRARLTDDRAPGPVLQTDAPGHYLLSLTVSDRIQDSDADTVLVTAVPWFTDVTETAGVPGGGAQDYQSGYGPGAAWGDFDDDGDPDLYVTRDGPNFLYRNNGDGTFSDVATEAGAASSLNSYGAVWGDYDNDGALDLYVVNHGADQEGDLDHVPGQANALLRNNGDGTFTDVARDAGAAYEAHGAGAIWGDFDTDGSLDLFITNIGVLGDPESKGEPDLLLRNNADGTFAEVGAGNPITGGDAAPSRTGQPGSVPSGISFGAVWFDYDGDDDADLFVTQENGVSHLYRNEGSGAFIDVTEEAGLWVSGRARGAVSGDYDNDGDFDLFVTGPGRNRLWRNNGDGAFTDVAQAAGVAGDSAGWGAGFIDVDNDGHLDIFVTGGPSDPGDAAASSNRLYRNNGDGAFTDVTRLADIGGGGVARAVAFADYDGDGDLDIYVVNADGDNVLYRNEIGSRMNWIGIRLLGTASNLKGIGGKVEVTTRDGVTRTLSPSGGSGYLGQNDTDVLFGLGAADRVDIRVTWPNGVVQDFWDVWANALGRVRESTMEGSCPLVFAWDGSGYSFVSDVLGSAVTGFALAPEVYRFPIDTDEYLKIEGLEPRDGSYSIRIVELMNEIIYLDQAKLLVIDHPSDLTAYPNERLNLFPPFPEAGMYLASNLRPPVAALDQEGNDILSLISERDGIYAEPVAYLPYEGFAEQYSIVLDLGDLSDLENILFVLNGWTHYVTSFGLHEASQDGIGPMLPRLDVVDQEGEWTPVAMDMGFPGGQPKTMTYDLTGKFPTDDYRVRITTNLQIFWDQILVGSNADDVTPRITELAVTTADLHWLGYPVLLQATGDRRMRPAAYDYNVVQADRDRWAIPEGRYTKYGDATPLLDGVDDMFVVMRHGDELALEFSADGLPDLEPGWSRSIVLYLDGYLKYVDPYVAHGSSVAPLPFHAMSNYPYPPGEAYPSDEAHTRYLREYNTRQAGQSPDSE